MKRVTQLDIAKKAKVDRSTVSLALRSHPSIPEPTRKKIKKIAEELGYHPDPALASLVAYRKGSTSPHYKSTLAIISNGKTPKSWLAYDAFKDFYDGILKRAKELGYEVEEFTLSPAQNTPAQLLRICRNRNILGWILAPGQSAGDDLELDCSFASCVSLGYSLQSPITHRLSNNRYHASRLAVNTLYSKGFRRFGFAAFDGHEARTDHAWSAGFDKAIELLGRKVKASKLASKNWHHEACIHWFKKTRPEVIITPTHDPQMWLEASGIRVPDDVSIAYLEKGREEKEMGGIYHCFYEVGSASVDLVSEMLQTNEKGLPKHPKNILLDGEWIDGASVKTPLRND